MAQNSVPVFLSGGIVRVRPNMRAWRMRPNPVRREAMQPGKCEVFTGAQAQQRVATN